MEILSCDLRLGLRELIRPGWSAVAGLFSCVHNVPRALSSVTCVRKLLCFLGGGHSAKDVYVSCCFCQIQVLYWTCRNALDRADNPQETDKATMDVEAQDDGVMAKIIVSVSARNQHSLTCRWTTGPRPSR